MRAYIQPRQGSRLSARLEEGTMKHEVTFTVPERPLEKVDIEFDVKCDGETLGTLKVSKGDVEWRRRDDSKGYHLRWAKFDEVMQKHGIKR
jgi:hypothetical protein